MKRHIVTARAVVSKGARSVFERVKRQGRGVVAGLIEVSSGLIAVYAFAEIHRVAGLFALSAVLYAYSLGMDPPSRARRSDRRQGKK